MPETHINAYYADLLTAKQEAAAAQQRVALLEEQIKAKGGALPGEETDTQEASQEDTASSNDVSAAESRPLSKLNRSELNARASQLGIESPELLSTNKDVISAIKGVE